MSFKTNELRDAGLSAQERRILREYETNGCAVANRLRNRGLWDWASEKGIAVYVGQALYDSDGQLIQKRSPLASPFYRNSPRFETSDGTAFEVLESYYRYISDKPSLHPMIMELKTKIVFGLSHPNPCTSDLLLALSLGEIPFLESKGRGRDAVIEVFGLGETVG